MTGLRVWRGRSAVLTVGAVSACVLVLAAGAGPAPAQSPPSVRFGPCPQNAGTDNTTGCTRIEVPLDYARPAGRKISLMVAVKAAAGTPSQRQGLLFVNPGGPGVGALWLASTVWDELPPSLQDAYEVVAIDPRGVGHSTPMSCHIGTLYRPPLPDLVPANKKAEQADVARAKATARACARRYSNTFLDHIDTTDMARDMDTVRAALGAGQINYLGYSYGTYLGEVYGQLYPSHLRRMILDSVVDPTISGYQASFRQDVAFQARLPEFFSWIAARESRYHLGSSEPAVARRWHAIRRQLTHQPAGGRVGPSELDEATAEALYNTTSWPGLAQALGAYERGHDQPLTLSGKILNGASNGSFLAVTCRDTMWPTNWTTWQRDARREYASAPLLTWENTWENAPCAFWPVSGGPATDVTGHGVHSVLLLQSRHDPATPMADALHVKALYGSAAGIVLEAGGNHGQYLVNNNACMDRYGDAYLLNGTLPPHQATCASTTKYAAGDAFEARLARGGSTRAGR